MYKKIIFIIAAQVFLFVSLNSFAQNEFSDETSSDVQINPDQDIKAAEEKTEQEAVPEVEAPTSKAKLRSCKCKYNVDTPYRERRTRWGGTVGFQWGAFRPLSFTPVNNSLSYEARYGTATLGSIEMIASAKLNFALGSIGPQISVGSFTATNTTSGSTMNIIPVTAGIIYSMDNILKEPYIVPYGVFGAYSGYYKETIGAINGANGTSATGYAPIGMFYSAGVMFQLDWIDDDSHESGYEEYGMENTFLYVEGRTFLQAPIITNLLTDMSTPIQIFAGLKTEF